MFNDWDDIISTEMRQPYFESLARFVEQERQQHTVYPTRENVFTAFSLTPLSTTSVVILGQDPYHGPGQAHGLSFSVQRGALLPPSLRNIMKERQSDIGISVPLHGDLTPWAKQGVLLLNSSLTVRHGEAASHQGRGWEIFTDSILRYVQEKQQRVVFILWGNSAQSKRKLITNPHHIVLTAPHPSPLSAHRGFFGSKPFSHTNRALVDAGLPAIDWNNE